MTLNDLIADLQQYVLEHKLVLQDFIAASVIRKVYRPTEQLVCRKCGSSEVMPWPTK